MPLPPDRRPEACTTGPCEPSGADHVESAPGEPSRVAVHAELPAWRVRVVLLGLRDGQRHVRAVVAALVPRADGEHRLRRAAVLAHQAAQVAHAVAAAEEPERPLTEKEILTRDLVAGVGERPETHRGTQIVERRQPRAVPLPE